MGINVLSLFDGMSCGQIALERAGIKVDNYYASEIDPYAIKITMKNYPKTIQLGSITEWRKWDIPKPDIICGGSPCQGFSFSGKGLNFNDPRSKLFFEFADILKHYHPKVFLLENVIMKADSNDVISSMLGDLYPECIQQSQLFKAGRLEPIMINSALVSAQNRERLYWTNIKGVVQPEDKGILLKDILESGETERGIEQQINIRKDEKSNCVVGTFPHKLNGVAFCKQIGEAGSKGKDSFNRVYSVDFKGPTLTAICGGHQEPKISEDNIHWRKLTVLECERLQTVPDNYTDGVSNSRRYHALGNGWTVDVIAHIFSYLPKEYYK